MTPPSAAVFHPTHAAFSGYGLIRRRWRSILVWAGLRFAISIVMTVAVILLAGADLGRIAAMAQGGVQQSTTYAELLAALRGMGPLALLVWPVSFLQEVVLVTAVYRAYLHPDQSKWAYLRLGRAELITAAVTILWWALFLAGIFLVTFLVLILTGLAQSISPLVGSLWAVVGSVGVIVLLVWGLVRSSLAWVDSYERGSISLFHSLKLTHGHVVRLLLSYVLALAVMIVLAVVSFIGFVILATIAALASGQGAGSVRAVFDPDSSSLAAYFSVAMFAWLLFLAVALAASYAAIFGPSAEAYLAFKAQGEPVPPVDAEVFA